MGNVSLLSSSSDMTQQVARTFAERVAKTMPVDGVRTILLQGELGAGKTTFSKGFLSYFDIVPHQASPTFILMRRYTTEKSGVSEIYHIDAYRLSNSSELKDLDIDNVVSGSGNIILVEWPENVSEMVWPNPVKVQFDHGDVENERTITFSAVK
jgi:tRNA threonylcarbamoyladenosine biosynthesis protein TsaE